MLFPRCRMAESISCVYRFWRLSFLLVQSLERTIEWCLEWRGSFMGLGFWVVMPWQTWTVHKILCREYVWVVPDIHCKELLVWMVNTGHPVSTSGRSLSHIMRCLYLLKAQVTCVGTPDWCSNVCVVGQQKCLLTILSATLAYQCVTRVRHCMRGSCQVDGHTHNVVASTGWSLSRCLLWAGGWHIFSCVRGLKPCWSWAGEINSLIEGVGGVLRWVLVGFGNRDD